MNVAPMRADVAAEEWSARVDLAACYRLADHYGWTDMIFTHISARVPGPEDHFLINPFGTTFGEITASSLVKVDQDGKVLSQSDYGINPAGFVIHSAVHAARPDIDCVIHLHTDDGVAVSAQKHGLLPLSQHAMIVLGLGVSYHDYEGIALDLDERERLVADLGSNNLMMLRNHGTLGCGETVAAAFTGLFHLERACAIQTRALAGGAEVIQPSQAAQDLVADQVRGRLPDFGATAWPALLRLLDAKDPSYKN